MRPTVIEVKKLSDVLCKNCIYFNEDRCMYDNSMDEMSPDDRCTEHGTWLCEGKLYNFRGVCLTLKTHPVVTDIGQLICQNCISFFPVRKECHYRRVYSYQVLDDDWCNNGCWLYMSSMEDNEELIMSSSYSNMKNQIGLFP